MEIQVLNTTAATSAPLKPKIFIEVSFVERFREITRAIFLDSLHFKTTITQRSAVTPWEGLMIGQLCPWCRCSFPLRRSSDELSVAAIVVAERRRIEAVGDGDRHGHAVRRHESSVVSVFNQSHAS